MIYLEAKIVVEKKKYLFIQTILKTTKISIIHLKSNLL